MLEEQGAKTSEKKKVFSYVQNYSQGICPICCERGLIIPCKLCNKEACKECIRRYILDNEKERHSCMYCNVALNRHTIVEMLGITFVKGTLTEFQQRVAINKHKTILPTFQPIAERQIQRDKLKAEMDELNALYTEKRREYYNFENFSSKKNSQSQYTRPCSMSDCNGFINTEWKCGICGTKTCKDCFEPIMDDDHVCEAGAKETASLLKKDTRNCPKCGTGIYKIEGCDQMYCTICHTAFSWRTGVIESGRIHNPHYYQHLRNMAPNGQIPREPDDVIPCCAGEVGNNFNFDTSHTCSNIMKLFVDIPDLREIMKEYDNKIKYVHNFMNYFFIDLIQYFYHVQSHCTMINRTLQGFDNVIRDLSVVYLRKKISQETMEAEIKKNHKKKEILNEKIMILGTLKDVINDIIVEIFNEKIRPIIEATRNSVIYKVQISNLSKVQFKPYIIPIKPYIELIAGYAEELETLLVNKQNEIQTIIDYAVAEQKKVNKSYGIISEYDIHYKKGRYYFLSPMKIKKPKEETQNTFKQSLINLNLEVLND